MNDQTTAVNHRFLGVVIVSLVVLGWASLISVLLG